jgi:hypothetical protein
MHKKIFLSIEIDEEKKIRTYLRLRIINVKNC